MKGKLLKSTNGLRRSGRARGTHVTIKDADLRGAMEVTLDTVAATELSVTGANTIAWLRGASPLVAWMSR